MSGPNGGRDSGTGDAVHLRPMAQRVILAKGLLADNKYWQPLISEEDRVFKAWRKKRRSAHNNLVNSKQPPHDSQMSGTIVASPEVQDKITRFKRDLGQVDTQSMVRKYLTFGESHVLSAESYFQLRISVAKQFRLHPSEAMVVGSGKLGFSIAPTKRYRPFCETSDIDVAIVSSELFDIFWRELHAYQDEGGYWPRADDFAKYFFRGWMRPDKMPPSRMFPAAMEWWDFFQELTSSRRFGMYKISGALYRDWRFLDAYQSICVKQCQQEGELNK